MKPSSPPDPNRLAARPGPVPLIAGLGTVFVALLVSGLLTGTTPGIADTDGFMRLVRVDELSSGAAGWFDGAAMRSNAPFGHSMHWTRPLDVLVLVLALPVTALGSANGLEIAALAVGPLVLGAVSAVMAWAAVPVAGRVGGLVAGLGVGLQPTLLAYGSVGRVDHHGLIFLATATLAGLAARLVSGSGRRTAMAAGVASAAGVWVSTEFLLPVAVFLLGCLVAWIVSGMPNAEHMRTFSVAWSLALAAVLVVERAPDALFARDLDRVSLVHLLVALLAAGFWFIVAALPDESRRWVRLATALGAGVATSVLLWLLAPEFASGPFGDVPPELWDAWLSRVAELQPLWPFDSDPLRTLYLLAAPILGIALSIWAAHRSGHRGWWWSMAVIILGLSLLGAAQARFTAFAQLMAVIPLGWLSCHLVSRIGDASSIAASLKRVGAMTLGVTGFLLPVLAVAAFDEPTPAAPIAERCEIDTLIEHLASKLGSPIVLAHIDWGPEILYRTDASVLATPYHRNVDGILDARRVLGSAPEDAAEIVATRGIDVIVVCPDRAADYLADERTDGDVLSLIIDLSPPAWLELLDQDEQLRIFEVDPARLP